MIFEWVVTDAPDAAMVGSGLLDPARTPHNTTRAALLVAASLPGLFVVEDYKGTALVRGKCSEISFDIRNKRHAEPLKMAQTFYTGAHRVTYKLGDAVMGIYI